MREEKKLTGYPSIDKPWLKYYTEEAINAPLPECTVYEYLYENNKDYPSDIAINYLGRKISYKELFENIDKTAAAFLKAGVKEKEIVTVALPSIPEALYVVYALNKIGAVANMIHPLAGEREIVNYLNEVKSEIAILFEGTYKIVKDSIHQTSVRNAVVVSAGESLPFGVKQFFFLKTPRAKLPSTSIFQSWKTFLAGGDGVKVPPLKKDCYSMALISHTGGTTGVPKGVMCSDYNINALIYQLICNFEYDRQNTCLAQLPPFINYSLIDSMLAMLFIGFQVALIPDYKPDKIGNYFRRYKPFIINSIPAYWEALLKIRNIRSVDMSSLHLAYYGGESMSAENEAAVNEVLKACGAKGKILKGLGSTEMMAAATQAYPDCNDSCSVGVPLVFVNCKIVKQGTFDELPYQTEGEICFSGPTLMLGYYNNKAETDKVIKTHADGQRWLHTGDLGYLDENGVLFVTGRIKRIIMTKGTDQQITKMFPDRIEKAIYQHSSVELCCVIGLPDENRINYPKAFVVLKGEKPDKNRITKEIMQICREELPDYMVPDEFEYRSELPRTPRGKVDYRALEEMAKDP